MVFRDFGWAFFKAAKSKQDQHFQEEDLVSLQREIRGRKQIANICEIAVSDRSGGKWKGIQSLARSV